MKRGNIVKQVVVPVQGKVSGFQIDQHTGDKLIEVTWADNDGSHTRFFKEEDLELVSESDSN